MPLCELAVVLLLALLGLRPWSGLALALLGLRLRPLSELALVLLLALLELRPCYEVLLELRSS